VKIIGSILRPVRYQDYPRPPCEELQPRHPPPRLATGRTRSTPSDPSGPHRSGASPHPLGTDPESFMTAAEELSCRCQANPQKTPRTSHGHSRFRPSYRLPALRFQAAAVPGLARFLPIDSPEGRFKLPMHRVPFGEYGGTPYVLSNRSHQVRRLTFALRQGKIDLISDQQVDMTLPAKPAPTPGAHVPFLVRVAR
jgi:hypothetical protein